jgi:tetratricopeptide (TPR) repeat protein
MIQGKQHDDAIVYVDKFRRLDPSDFNLQRLAALARGGKGEHILESFDRLGVAPSKDRIDQMIELFKEAIEIDPTLPDPYWDLAVIYARFLKEPRVASGYLNQAKKLGYEHPMMEKLEELIGASV